MNYKGKAISKLNDLQKRYDSKQDSLSLSDLIALELNIMTQVMLQDNYVLPSGKVDKNILYSVPENVGSLITQGKGNLLSKMDKKIDTIMKWMPMKR